MVPWCATLSIQIYECVWSSKGVLCVLQFISPPPPPPSQALHLRVMAASLVYPQMIMPCTSVEIRMYTTLVHKTSSKASSLWKSMAWAEGLNDKKIYHFEYLYAWQKILVLIQPEMTGNQSTDATKNVCLYDKQAIKVTQIYFLCLVGRIHLAIFYSVSKGLSCWLWKIIKCQALWCWYLLKDLCACSIHSSILVFLQPTLHSTSTL